MGLLWSNEPGANYHASVVAAPAWLAPEHVDRWQRLRACRMLFEGRHRLYFLDETRSQFPFRPLLAQGRLIRLYVTVNLLKLISNTTADLLLAAKPKIEASTDQQTQRLNELARNSLIHPRLRAAAVQASWAGGAFLESLLWNGQPYLMTVEPDSMYPLGAIMPDGQYERYVRYATQNIGTADKPKNLLLTTTYAAGVITRQLQQLDSQGRPMAGDVELSQWPQFSPGANNATPPPEQSTGLDRPTITYIPNIVDEKLEQSDYDGLIELQDSVNAKRSQIARVLVLHADPKMWFDTQAANNDGTVRAEDNAFFGAIKPEYITWDAQLDAANKDYESSMLSLCAAAEMSPVGLGLMTGGQAAESARKRRLDMTKDIAKAGRKALYFEPAAARAIETTQMLDQTTGLLRSYPVEPIAINFQDGLPADPLDKAQEAQTWRAAGLMSVPAGVAMRIEDPVAAKLEVAEIEKENDAKMPSVFAPLGGNLNDSQDAGAGQQQPGGAA